MGWKSWTPTSTFHLHGLNTSYYVIVSKKTEEFNNQPIYIYILHLKKNAN